MGDGRVRGEKCEWARPRFLAGPRNDGGREGDSRIAPTGEGGGRVREEKCEWASPRFRVGPRKDKVRAEPRKDKVRAGPRNDRVRVGPRIDTGARKSERGRVGSESEFSRYAFAMPMGLVRRSGFLGSR